MRLGREQAAGYVEDTEADSLPGHEVVLDRPGEAAEAAPEPSLAAG